MLTVDQARLIADQWRPQFANKASFEQSWTRFFDMVGDPTPDKLEFWLAKDQSKDAVRHAGIVREPLVRPGQHHQLSDCTHCWSDVAGAGLRYVREVVDIGHPNFGKALPCPRCNR